ncbi:MAG: glycosyltransferase family 9 protein [Sulfuricaulis sp.]
MNNPGNRLNTSGISIRMKYVFKTFLSYFLLLFDWIPAIGVRRKVDGKRHLLIVRVDLIGDFVLWLPAARALRDVFPREQWHVTLLANAAWADLAAGQGIFDKVWPVDTQHLVASTGYRYRMLRQMRTAGFDVAIEPTYSRDMLRGDALIRASGALERIGSQGDCSNTGPWMKRITDRWYTRLIAADPQPMMELRRNAEFVKGLGGRCEIEMPRLHVEQDALPAELHDKQYFVLFPGASKCGKCWPLERFSEIAQHAVKHYGLQGVVCGGTVDKSLAEELCRMATVPLQNLTGKTSLRQITAILAHARLVLTNDTSAAHIGPAVGTPTVCILGGGHYGRFLPYDLPDSRLAPRVVSHRMDCFGCNWRCIYRMRHDAPFPCVDNVSTEQAWASITEVLGAENGVTPGEVSAPFVTTNRRG